MSYRLDENSHRVSGDTKCPSAERSIYSSHKHSTTINSIGAKSIEGMMGQGRTLIVKQMLEHSREEKTVAR